MYRPVQCLVSLRSAAFLMQGGCMRAGVSSLSCRDLQSCSKCLVQKTIKSVWKLPIRNFSQCLRSRTTVVECKNPYAMNRTNLPSAYARFAAGSCVTTQHRDANPYCVSRRAFGVSVSGGEDVEGVYIPTPTEKCYELLEYIHDTAGLPWWMTIAATTVLFRGLFVFPFAVWQQTTLARIENAQPLINAYVEQIKQQLAIIAKEKGWSRRKLSNVFTKEVRLVVSNIHFQQRCSSHKLAYLPFWQTGVWVSMTMAIGQMTGKHPELFSTDVDIDVLPGLSQEGVLWFSDLMQTDLSLAVLLGLVNITLVELWSLRRGPLTRTQHVLHNSFRVAAFCSIPAAAFMPAAVSFYWLVSSLCGLGQLGLLRIPSVRRKVGIPYAPGEMKRPMDEMKAGLKARYSKKVF